VTVFEIEELRQNILTFLSESKSCRQRLIFIKDFYSAVLGTKNNSIIDSYVVEFFSEFLECAEHFEVFCFPPNFTSEIIEQLNILKKTGPAENYLGVIEKISGSLSLKLGILNKILDGNDEADEPGDKLLFPLIESVPDRFNQFPVGALETFTINIRRSKGKNDFIIVPSYESSSASLLDQINISWEIAYGFVKKNYYKIGRYHQVVIYFDHHYGNYTGLSLGAALTLEFIQGIISLYNFPFSISVKHGIVITGGFGNRESFLSMDKETIENKVAMVFYSASKNFVIPEESKKWAVEKLNELKKNYPKRNLEITGISTLQDLLNRRNIVDVKKQSIAVRSIKFAKSNLAFSISLLTLILVVTYFYLFNFDDNPAVLFNQGNNLFVENKSGKVLWTKKMDINSDMGPNYLRNYERVFDINDDKRNEVLLCQVNKYELKHKEEEGSIFCFNSFGQELWHYKFKDTVQTKYENLEPVYKCFFIDTVTENGKKLMLAAADNGPSFSSAIFTIDLSTGKRTGTTFWNPGFIVTGLTASIRDKNDKLIIFAGANNGYEKSFIAGIELNKLYGYAPSTPHYTFSGMKPANLLFYILLPKTDYLKHFNSMRESGIFPGSLINSVAEKKFLVTVSESNYKDGSLVYRLDYNLKDITIIVDSGFRIQRDSLVAHGILSPPLTDTPEYCKLLKDQILYWNGQKFVNRSELK